MAITFGYFAHTAPGIEPISWLEIRKHYPQATFGEYLFIKGQQGIATFSHEGLLTDITELRTVSAVYLQLVDIPKLSRARKDIKAVADLLRSEEVGQAANGLMRQLQFSQPPSYHISVQKVGQYGYKLGDMRRAIERSLAARLPRWQQVPAEGQVEILAELIGNQMLIGFRLTSSNDHVPYKRKKQSPTALPAPTAAAMVFLTEPEPEEWFLDPMCGSGTLLLARRHAGSYDMLLGGDIDAEQVAMARRNVLHRRHGHRDRPIEIREWDARELPIEGGAVDKLATFLPNDSKDGKLYSAVLQEFARVVDELGRVVVFSHDYDAVKTALRDVPELTLQTGYSALVNGRWGRIYIIQRNSAETS